jgi:homoserine dehydrogenase
MTASDKPGVVAAVAGILGDAGISIEAMSQKEPAAGETEVPLVMLTHRVSERQMNAAIGKIEALDSVAGAVTRIRVEHLG